MSDYVKREDAEAVTKDGGGLAMGQSCPAEPGYGCPSRGEDGLCKGGECDEATLDTPPAAPRREAERVSDYVKREKLARRLRQWEQGAREAAKAVPATTAGGIERRIHDASAAAYALAATETEGCPAAPVDELVKAARGLLAAVDADDADNDKLWQVIYENANRLEAALAALDGDPQ